MLTIPALVAIQWFFPGVGVSVVMGYLVRARVGIWLGVSPMLGWAAVISLGIIGAATLTPLREIPSEGRVIIAGCDFTRVGLASRAEILKFDDTSLNILLFSPLGVILAFVRPVRARALYLAGALALPVMIETTQLLAIPLERACQSADVFDNGTGLIVGFILGSIVVTIGAVFSILRSWFRSN